jgi:hypothetical protein
MFRVWVPCKSRCANKTPRGNGSRDQGTGGLLSAPNTEKPFDKYEPPICFMQVPDFRVVPYNSDAKLQLFKVRQNVHYQIHRKRECASFIKWRQGFTPKEHLEMLDRELRMQMDERREKEERRWHIVEIILIVVLSGLFTLLGAFIGRGGL